MHNTAQQVSRFLTDLNRSLPDLDQECTIAGMNIRPWTLIACALLLGCTESAPHRVTHAQRAQEAEIVLAKTPQPRTYTIDGNHLVVVDVPVSDGGGFVDMQRCFVWRDAEYKTATLSCPSTQDTMPIEGHATGDDHNP